MPRDARLTDSTNHGGVIISGSPNVITNNLPTARITDLHACPLHGINIIVSGSPNVIANGLNQSKVLDVCSCGALIATGSPNVIVNG